MARLIVALLVLVSLGGCMFDTAGLAPVDGGPEGDADSDGDGDGDGDADLPDGCVPETCNYQDDDCDGLIDDGFNLSSDPEHCGSCDIVCPRNPPNGAEACIGGSCTVRCDTGFRDCNEDDVDGCEADLSAPETCGACDVRCEEEAVCEGELLSGYSCVGQCTAPLVDCAGRCVDTNADILNCGECGVECPDGEHGEVLCDGGTCGFVCDENFGDCEDGVSGCETQLVSLENCGACGELCDLANADVSCREGACAIEQCHWQWDDCDGVIENGCEQDLLAVEHCGTCGSACEEGEECLYGICVPPCQLGCTCRDRNCSTSSPCVCDPGCHCTELSCASDCEVTCSGADTLCIVDAVRVSNLNDFLCDEGATCIVDVTNGGNFQDNVLCRSPGTACFLTCESVSNCYPSCLDGAACVLDCTDASNCEFDLCEGVQIDCGDDILTCNAPCP